MGKKKKKKIVNFVSQTVYRIFNLYNFNNFQNIDYYILFMAKYNIYIYNYDKKNLTYD